jgi:hypothetical protein
MDNDRGRGYVYPTWLKSVDTGNFFSIRSRAKRMLNYDIE